MKGSARGDAGDGLGAGWGMRAGILSMRGVNAHPPPSSRARFAFTGH